VLSEELSKYDAQMENATNKIIDVLRNLYKGDESRLKTACRIADRMTRFVDGQLMVESPESYVMNYQCCAPYPIFWRYLFQGTRSSTASTSLLQRSWRY